MVECQETQQVVLSMDENLSWKKGARPPHSHSPVNRDSKAGEGEKTGKEKSLREEMTTVIRAASGAGCVKILQALCASWLGLVMELLTQKEGVVCCERGSEERFGDLSEGLSTIFEVGLRSRGSRSYVYRRCGTAASGEGRYGMRPGNDTPLYLDPNSF